MWNVVGSRVDNGLFEPFKPVEILYDFDGPRTFTHRDKDAQLCLAHWCDEDGDATRFIVVPFSEKLTERLKQGELTLRDALDQPRAWVVDISPKSDALRTWLTRIADIPDDILPYMGTMLLPSLEPLISLRAVGVDIQEGRVPGSVVRGLVEGVQKAVKLLAEYVLEQPTQTGRPSALLKRMFDLPTQRLAFGSFEIAFRSPLSGPPELFKEVTATAIEQEATILQKIGTLLQTGLDWLHSQDALKRPAGPASDPEESRVILQAIKSISPSSQGPLREVEIQGTLVRSPVHPIRLTREMRKRATTALSALPPGGEKFLRLTGRIRELDKDSRTFTLREIEGENTARECTFEEEFLEDVLQALDEEYRVNVAMVSVRNKLHVLAILKSTE